MNFYISGQYNKRRGSHVEELTAVWKCEWAVLILWRSLCHVWMLTLNALIDYLNAPCNAFTSWWEDALTGNRWWCYNIGAVKCLHIGKVVWETSPPGGPTGECCWATGSRALIYTPLMQPNTPSNAASLHEPSWTSYCSYESCGQRHHFLWWFVHPSHSRERKTSGAPGGTFVHINTKMNWLVRGGGVKGHCDLKLSHCRDVSGLPWVNCALALRSNY